MHVIFDPLWLGWARALDAHARTGMYYAGNIYDYDRYRRIQEIAHVMLARGGEAQLAKIVGLFNDTVEGYVTPKVEVRAVVFRDNKILMVQERQDGLWSIPGGFADLEDTPSVCVEREVLEEAGLVVKAMRVIAVWDNRCHGHPPYPFHLYRLCFACSMTDHMAEPKTGSETLGVDWFAEDDLPPLSTPRLTIAQVTTFFRYHRDPLLPTIFD